jgi:hypothetical protein
VSRVTQVRFKQRLFISLLMFLIGTDSSWTLAIEAGEPWIAQIRRDPDTEKRIRALALPRLAGVHMERWASEEPQYFIILKGKLRAPIGWILLINQTQVLQMPRDGESGFEHKITLSGVKTSVPVEMIGPMGQIRKEVFEIDYPGYGTDELGAMGSTEGPPAQPHSQAGSDETSIFSRFHFTGGVGGSLLSFSQTNRPELTQFYLTPKSAVDFDLIPGKWSIGANFYFNALRFYGDPDEIRASFVGVNFRAGYQIPQVPDPWRLRLMVGATYMSMMVSGANLGFQNLMSPHVYPVITRTLTPQTSAYLYMKYAPLADAVYLLEFGSREMAFGMGWLYHLPSGHSLSVSFDYSNLSFDFIGASIRSSATTLGVGFGF